MTSSEKANTYGLEFYTTRDIKFYNLLYKETYKRYINIGFKYLNQRNLIEDGVSDMFLKVYYKIEQFNPEYKFNTWMGTIFKNEMISILRNKSMRKEHLIGDFFDSSVIYEPYEKSNEEYKKLLQKSLKKLREPFTSLIIDKYYMGLSQDEMSNKYGVKIQDIKNMLFNARRHLKGLVKDENYSYKIFHSNKILNKINERQT